MIEFAQHHSDANQLVALNIRRLLARLGWRYDDLVEASGLDERTIRRLVRGETEPRPGTIHKLAEALGVATDELFLDTPALFAGEFDRATNPQVAAAVDSAPERFAGWSGLDFDELHSRFGVGGELTVAGALEMADAMNDRRETLERAKQLLETSDGELLREFVDMLYRRAAGENVATVAKTVEA